MQYCFVYRWQGRCAAFGKVVSTHPHGTATIEHQGKQLLLLLAAPPQFSTGEWIRVFGTYSEDAVAVEAWDSLSNVSVRMVNRLRRRTRQFARDVRKQLARWQHR